MSCCLLMMLELVILIKSQKWVYEFKTLHGSRHALVQISKEQGKGCVWEGKAAAENVFQWWLMWELLAFYKELVCPALQMKHAICLSQKNAQRRLTKFICLFSLCGSCTCQKDCMRWRMRRTRGFLSCD